MPAKLKCAAIGTGGIWNACHAGPLLKNKDVEIVAACDIVESKARTFADANNIPHVYTDYKKLLADLKDLDWVDICTPNVLHSEIAVAALNKGINVFCEKPDAVNPKEAQRMADAAKKSGKKLMVMRNNRFWPATQFLKKYIDAGHFGEAYTGRCGWIRRRGIPGKGGWFTTKSQSGGGPLIDLGVHMLDVAVWLMGNPRPVAVVGATYRKFDDADTSDSVHSQFGQAKAGGTFDVEDLATGFVRFDNGATLQIEFSWASNIEREAYFVELRGTKAGCNWLNGELKLYTEQAGGLLDITPRLPSPPRDIGIHGANLYHFVDVLKGRAKPIFVPQQGVDMIKILSAIYASAESGREVKL